MRLSTLSERERAPMGSRRAHERAVAARAAPGDEPHLYDASRARRSRGRSAAPRPSAARQRGGVSAVWRGSALALGGWERALRGHTITNIIIRTRRSAFHCR